MENWKPIVGYEGLYEISDCGRVKSVQRKVYNPAVLGDGVFRTVPERILKPNILKGFCAVHLKKNGHSKGFRVHRLVAEHFIGQPECNGLVVFHKDGNKQNNCVDNLEWKSLSDVMDGCRKPISDETKQKIASASRLKWADPDMRKMLSEKSKQRWQNEEYKVMVSKAISDGWKRRQKNVESVAKKLSFVPDLPDEVWKDVSGFDGHYAVSNFGRVKSLHRDLPHAEHGVWHISERLLKQRLAGKESSRYYSVSLHIGNGKMKNKKVHRMVAEAFIPRVQGKDFINHKDGNKLNNFVSNLEWCTPKENSDHAWENGLCENVREAHRQRVINIETGEVFQSINEACRKYGISHRCIYQAANKQTRTAAGYHWQYAERDFG